ncbi:MAG: Gfo/Idh/MocA family oxidoreductase [Phycisphaerae bacterium]|nr:Gfo/Idh/MocA family oxidoreductase [Phycisphaerae bacterium]
MAPLNRRSFLKSSAKMAGVAGAAVVGASGGPAHGVTGANEKIRLATIGVHGQGFYHVKRLMELKKKGKNVDVVALCDIDEQVLAGRAGELEKMRGEKPATFTDLRKVYEDKSIDAVTIGMPNHWHALATIWACQAGKDVYVEKPCSWCIREGRKMVDAARKYQRIVKVGQHLRSDPGNGKATAELRAGLIGDVYMARSLVFRRRDSIGVKQPCDPPKHIHFDLWLGPAPKQAYHENLVHYNWHWFWDFGNGEIGNNGIHAMDLARWGMNKTLPVKVSSMGGRYGYTPPDQAQTPNTQLSTLTFGDGTMLVCDVRNRFTNQEEKIGVGNLFYGSQGYFANGKPSFGYGGAAYGGKPAPEIKLDSVGGKREANQYENFINAVRSRKYEDLNCDVLEGHYSAVLFHMANISYRVGRTLTFDPKTETFVGDGAKEANAFLTREYRAPFVVPERV